MMEMELFNVKTMYEKQMNHFNSTGYFLLHKNKPPVAGFIEWCYELKERLERVINLFQFINHPLAFCLILLFQFLYFFLYNWFVNAFVILHLFVAIHIVIIATIQLDIRQVVPEHFVKNIVDFSPMLINILCENFKHKRGSSSQLSLLTDQKTKKIPDLVKLAFIVNYYYFVITIHVIIHNH